VLLRQIGPDVAVDPSDLEQRDVVLSRVGVAAEIESGSEPLLALSTDGGGQVVELRRRKGG